MHLFVTLITITYVCIRKLITLTINKLQHPRTCFHITVNKLLQWCFIKQKNLLLKRPRDHFLKKIFPIVCRMCKCWVVVGFVPNELHFSSRMSKTHEKVYKCILLYLAKNKALFWTSPFVIFFLTSVIPFDIQEFGYSLQFLHIM